MKVLLTKAYAQESLKNFSPNLEITSIDFISTKKITSGEIIPKVAGEENFIVSSAKAAQYAVELGLKGNYFCVGKQSKEIISPYFKVIATCNNAQELTQEIIKHYPKEKFCFLCSNIRLNTIPNTLKEHNIILKEVIVYQTKLQSPTFNNNFEAYAFFSPSGVKSFFKTYKIPNKALIFAIGATTKNTLKTFINQPIFIPERPNFKGLINLINYKTNAKK